MKIEDENFGKYKNLYEVFVMNCVEEIPFINIFTIS